LGIKPLVKITRDMIAVLIASKRNENVDALDNVKMAATVAQE
jgi:hypothetical protein